MQGVLSEIMGQKALVVGVTHGGGFFQKWVKKHCSWCYTHGGGFFQK